jgi:isopentenyl-diphosphate Delta-isomerase
MTPAEPRGATASWRNDEEVIGVDGDDNEVGPVSRAAAHGLQCDLHRAFMMLLVDDGGRLILCKRSRHKRLWPGYWADSCAGHPRPGEDVSDAARRHVREELGCSAELRPLGHFVYEARYEGVGCEHELCHVFAGRACGELSPDPAEVSHIAPFEPGHLEVLLRERPNDFAPWLVACLRVFPPSVFVATSRA